MLAVGQPRNLFLVAKVELVVSWVADWPAALVVGKVADADAFVGRDRVNFWWWLVWLNRDGVDPALWFGLWAWFLAFASRRGMGGLLRLDDLAVGNPDAMSFAEDRVPRRAAEAFGHLRRTKSFKP